MMRSLWLVVLIFPSLVHAQQVALTFDDLPAHGDLPPGMSRAEVAQKILTILKAHHVRQAYGFINAQKLEKVAADRDVLTQWTAAGYPLGNHTYSHRNLTEYTAEEFAADIAANEPVLRELMPAGNWHWFRYPFLEEGNTPEKYHAVREYLQLHGYRVAQVTLDFHDYGWNGPYARCSAKNDMRAIEWLKQSYMASADASLDFGQQASRLLFDRDIRHVMLLHLGAFETVMLPELLDLLKKRHFKIVTLEKAQSDPAYKFIPEGLSSWSGSLIEQVAEARKMKTPPVAEWPEEKLAALCR